MLITQMQHCLFSCYGLNSLESTLYFAATISVKCFTWHLKTVLFPLEMYLCQLQGRYSHFSQSLYPVHQVLSYFWSCIVHTLIGLWYFTMSNQFTDLPVLTHLCPSNWNQQAAGVMVGQRVKGEMEIYLFWNESQKESDHLMNCGFTNSSGLKQHTIAPGCGLWRL